MYISHMCFSPSHPETRYQVICEMRFYETYAIYAVSPECNTSDNTTPTPMLPILLLGERPDLLQRKPCLPHPFPPEILDLFIQMPEQDLSPGVHIPPELFWRVGRWVRGVFEEQGGVRLDTCFIRNARTNISSGFPNRFAGWKMKEGETGTDHHG